MACRVCVYGTDRPAPSGPNARVVRGRAVPRRRPVAGSAGQCGCEHSDLPHVSAVAHEHCGLIPSDEPAPAAAARATGPCGLHRLRPGPQGLAALDGAGVAHQAPGRLRVHPSRQPRKTADCQPPACGTTWCRRRPGTRTPWPTPCGTWRSTWSSCCPPGRRRSPTSPTKRWPGGADVVCLQDSGNVADTVLRRGRGMVADQRQEPVRLLQQPARRRIRPALPPAGCRRSGQLVREGTTATLKLQLAAHEHAGPHPGQADDPGKRHKGGRTDLLLHQLQLQLSVARPHPGANAAAARIRTGRSTP